MSNFIYSKMSGKNDAMYGKFEHPIKMVIESESDALQNKTDVRNFLFNVEKSNRYAETVIAESDFDTFQSVKEGQGAENDSVETTYKKTIEHITFMKEFTITKEMADDSKIGISADIKSKPAKFVRAYYKTMNKICAWALANATKTSAVFAKAVVDLTTGDKLPLFSKDHPYFTDEMKGKTQSNYFYGEISADIETSLNVLSNKLRNFKDEHGESLDYVADVIILPCNRPHLEAKLRKACGSERTVGSNNNDINIQYGNWSIVVLPGWETTDDRFMIMSSEANKNLSGNLFFNRVPLDIRNNIDDHTRNYYWNGYTRFGVGFATWKHILLAVDSTTAITGATKLS
jgi:hypothetical protein